MTFKELCQRIILEAQRGGERAELANLDTQSILEGLMLDVFQMVGEATAADPLKRPLLRRTKTVAMVNGTGTIANDVLTKYFCDATFFDPADLTKTYSWVNDFFDFTGPLDDRLGYFCSSIENTIVQREPGAGYSTTTGFTGNMRLIIPCVPMLPASEGAQVAVADVIVSDIISVAAELLRGEALKRAREAA